MRYITLAICLSLAACGADEPEPIETQSPEPMTQEQRFNECREAMVAEFSALAETDADLLRTEPRVSPSAFLNLSDAEEERFVELSACIGAAGETGQRSVTILSSVNNAEISTLTARNQS